MRVLIRYPRQLFFFWPIGCLLLLSIISFPNHLAATPGAPLDGPVVNIPEIHDTVSCEEARYASWLNTVRFQLGLPGNITSDCGPIISIEYTPKDTLISPCQTKVVTFTIKDNCGFTTEWKASYTTTDKIAPVLNGVPKDTTVDCSAPLPAIPAVTATDNCSDALTPLFEEQTFPDQSCPDHQYRILRIWQATDACGNVKKDTMIILIKDLKGPTFKLPPNVTIDCSDDISDLNITGNVSNLQDNCDPSPRISYIDNVIDENCPHSITISRVWMATDECGNVSGKSQIITVIDTVPPVFTAPADITITCDEVNDLDRTGRPNGVQDNCDEDPEISISLEDVIQGDCPNTYVIRRTWRTQDKCGNFTEKIQTITVVDEQAPVLVSPAVDNTISCGNGDPDAAFQAWITAHGGAIARDNCTSDGELSWQAFNAGTTAPATLPPASCSVPGGPATTGMLQRRTVDFVVEDECGNTTVTSATFAVIDDTPPVIRNCPEVVVVPTAEGTCSGEYTIEPPLIEENCSTGAEDLMLSASATLTSAATPGNEGEVPVDPVELVFPFANLLPINANGQGTLVIRLNGVDGEEANEFFNIIGEDNQKLGQTTLTPSQCGSSTTTLPLSVEKINAWAADGAIVIRLVPNIPAGQPGTFAVNNICQPGRIEGDLSFQRRQFEGLVFSFRINDQELMTVNPIKSVTVALPQGVNRIAYYAYDCAGNIDSCFYFVRVEDQEPPALTCPDDLVVSAANGTCQATVTLPLPPVITDNCSVGEKYQQTQPGRLSDALLTFSYDPNLNDYLANDKNFTFTGLAANAQTDITVDLQFKGDFNTKGAFLILIGEDGSTLGQTTVGAANCTTVGQASFTIPKATFNTWAADGQLKLVARVNDIPVPPGVKGDGINPCDPSAVTKDGANDGTSFVRATIRYDNLLPSYFTEGATTLPLSLVPVPSVMPVHDFAVGETIVHYLVDDNSDNSGTCTFKVIVRDDEAPVATCRPTTLFINPSGVDEPIIDAAELDGGSRDNCGIDTLILTPNVFTCEQAGTTVRPTLTVIDGAGNTATCTTPVRIEALRPEPTATSGVCGNDTLYLFANPPAATGGTVFTYRWTGPNGFVSTLQDPVIPKVKPENAGSYMVEITGITGCKAIGTVEVAIENLPLTPTLLTETQICTNEDIELTSSVVPTGTGVKYRWYEGVPPNGTLLATTTVPTYRIAAPNAEGARTFYLTLEANGCVSSPSSPVTTMVSTIPTATVREPEITICSGGAITLGTDVAGPGITYEWTGPNGYRSTNQFPPVINNATQANAGVYRLVVARNGCPSTPATTVVNVLPRPGRPEISSNGPVCEGERVVLTSSISQASTYRWTSPSLQEFVTTTNEFVIEEATLEIAGQWRVRVAQFGCESDLSAPTNLTVNANPPTTASASQSTICEGTSLQLFASPTIGDATYRWTGPAGFTSASQNPVIDNISKNREGTYQVTITTASGCAGTASVTVVVQRRPVITGISNDGSDCLAGPTDIRLVASIFPPGNGTYSYRWSGPNDYASSDSLAVIPNASEINNGVYQLIVTSADGCVSAPVSTVVNVSDPPAPPSVPRLSTDTPTPLCAGAAVRLLTDPYSGNEVVYNWRTPNGIVTTTLPALDLPAALVADSGPYSVFVSINGCQSRESAPFNVTINHIPVVNIASNSPVCEGETIELRTGVVPGATYSWVGPSFTSSLANPDIPNAKTSQHNGIYTLQLSLNGCSSNLATSEVRVIPKPRRPTADNDGPLCISTGDPVLTLSIDPSTAISGATYSWYDPAGIIVESTTDLSVQLTELGRYGNRAVDFRVQAQLGGCVSDFSEPTTAMLNTIPSNQAFAGDDFRACSGQATMLAAETPSIGSGRWTLVAGNSEGVTIANPEKPNTAVNGLAGGKQYTFRWTLSNGACKDFSTDEVTVIVTESEVVNAGEDIIGCELREANLDATPVQTNLAAWTQSEVQELLGVRIADPSDPKTRITGLKPGNLYHFIWTVVGGCGEIKDEVFVLVSDPDPFAGLDQVACNDGTFAVLEADDPSEGSRGRWSSPDPTISFSDPKKTTATAFNLKPGENMLIWTIDEGICGDASRDTVTITFKENPVANPDEYVVSFGQPLEFDPRANDFVPADSEIRIVAPPRHGKLESTLEGTLVYTPAGNFLGMDQITYELCSEACECSLSTATFEVGEDAQCDIPSIFTPNNDGINDFFVVPCLLDSDEFPNNQVIIFNQWGDEVYHSEGPYKGTWRGTFNGEDVPAGTYFYIVDFGNGTPPKSGYVVIQR